MNNPPFISALAAAAAQMHELFLSLQEAGFSEEQAMRIVIATVTGRDPGSM